VLILDIDSKAFSLKYGIEIQKECCRKCGREVDVNIPVISKDFVGFESLSHECGLGYRISILKPRNEIEGLTE
jgi:hypothetical protein